MGECMNEVYKIEEFVKNEFIKLKRTNAKTIGQVASRIYKYVPKDEGFKDVIEHFFSINTYGYFSVATLWIKKHKETIEMKNMDFYEDLLYKYVKGWAKVDQFCYRCMNPMIELEDNNFEYLLKWSNTKDKDLKRASLVSMIKSSGKLTLDYDYDKMIYLVELLKEDEDIHVRKAVGWVLKCAFVTYPKKIEKYLRDNVKNLDRLIFRYALEHVNDPLRKELINLEYKS